MRPSRCSWARRPGPNQGADLLRREQLRALRAADHRQERGPRLCDAPDQHRRPGVHAAGVPRRGRRIGHHDAIPCGELAGGGRRPDDVRQALGEHLPQVFGVAQVLEPVLPQVAQRETGAQAPGQRLAGAVAQQDLPAVAGAADARPAVQRHPDVALRRAMRLVRVQAHAHPERHARGPGLGRQAPLGGHRPRQAVLGPREDVEEGVALGVHLLPAVPGEGRPEQATVAVLQLGVGLAAELLNPRGGALDVREQERDDAGGEAVAHGPSIARRSGNGKCDRWPHSVHSAPSDRLGLP